MTRKKSPVLSLYVRIQLKAFDDAVTDHAVHQGIDLGTTYSCVAIMKDVGALPSRACLRCRCRCRPPCILGAGNTTLWREVGG
jgi:hypothetical protein